MREIGNYSPMTPVQPPNAARKPGDGRRGSRDRNQFKEAEKTRDAETDESSQDTGKPHIDEYA